MRGRRSPKTSKVLLKHVKRRALERFQIEPTKEEVQQITKDIQKGRATFLSRQSLIVTIWEIRLRGKAMVAAYDKKRKLIRTVMPLEFYHGRETEPGLADNPETAGQDDS